MDELDQLKSQLRESKMRLRELRTENAELKIQMRRWLICSAAVSVLSLLLSFITVFSSGDIVIQSSHFADLGSGASQEFSDEAPLDSTFGNPIEQNPVEQKRFAQKSFEDADSLDVEAPVFADEDALEPPPLALEVEVTDTAETSVAVKPVDTKPRSSLVSPSWKVMETKPRASEESSSRSTNQSTAQGSALNKAPFVLPGASDQPKRRVEQYVVQKNDNLWKIIHKFWGTPTPQKIKKVMKDNGLSSPHIKPGHTLLLIMDDPKS